VAASYEGVVIDPSETIRKEQKKAIDERLEELREKGAMVLPKWGIFSTLAYVDTKRETRREIGFDGKLLGFTVGGDYRFTNKLVLGAAVSAFKEENDLVMNAGNTDIESYSYSLYGGYTPTDNIYFDFLGGFTDSNFESKRNVPGIGIRGEYSGSAIHAGFNAGYEYYYGAFNFGPRLESFYVSFDNDDLVERNEGGSTQATIVEGEKNESLLARLGAGVSYAMSFGWGVLSPQTSFFYQREFLDDSVELGITNISSGETGVFVTDDPDRDTFIGRLGLVAVMPQNVQFFMNYEQLFGHSYLETKKVNVGARVEF
jgi:outer membrane autotransporter protein